MAWFLSGTIRRRARLLTARCGVTIIGIDPIRRKAQCNVP
jgi:hypothetical protein